MSATSDLETILTVPKSPLSKQKNNVLWRIVPHSRSKGCVSNIVTCLTLAWHMLNLDFTCSYLSNTDLDLDRSWDISDPSSDPLAKEKCSHPWMSFLNCIKQHLTIPYSLLPKSLIAMLLFSSMVWYTLYFRMLLVFTSYINIYESAYDKSLIYLWC